MFTAAGGVSGTFNVVSLPALSDPLLSWLLFYEADAVSLAIAPTLSGDYNADGVVDAADYTVWRDSLGSIGIGLAADGDADGAITQADYNLWVSRFGQSLSPVAVPEPAAVALLLCCPSIFLPRRRMI